MSLEQDENNQFSQHVQPLQSALRCRGRLISAAATPVTKSQNKQTAIVSIEIIPSEIEVAPRYNC